MSKRKRLTPRIEAAENNLFYPRRKLFLTRLFSRHWQAVVVGLICAVPIILSFYIVLRYGANVPYWDEWNIVSLYRDFCENGLNLGKLASFQVLEHRIPVAIAAQMAIWVLTDMNDRVVLVISVCFLIATFVLIVLYWRRKTIPFLGICQFRLCFFR